MTATLPYESEKGVVKRRNTINMTTGARKIPLNLSNVLKFIGETSVTYYYEGGFKDALHTLKAASEFLSLPEIRPVDRASFPLTYGKIIVNSCFFTGSGDVLIDSVLNLLGEMVNALKNNSIIANSLILHGQDLYYRNLVTGKPEILVAQKTLPNVSNLLEETGDLYNLAEAVIFAGLTFEMEGSRAGPRNTIFVR